MTLRGVSRILRTMDTKATPRVRSLDKRTAADILWVWLLIGALAFFNHAWFFERHSLNASLVAATDPWQYQAMTLTYLTIGLCVLAYLLQRRSIDSQRTRQQVQDRSFWIIVGLSLFAALNLIYNPWVSPTFHTVPLELADWAYALGAMTIFVGIRAFQRLQEKHSRRAVLTLHRGHHKTRWHPHLRKETSAKG